MHLKYAFRMLVKDPWFTFVAVVALALGIGVNSTVFTFVNAVLVRGLPFPNADQIVHLNSRNTAKNAFNVRRHRLPRATRRACRTPNFRMGARMRARSPRSPRISKRR